MPEGEKGSYIYNFEEINEKIEKLEMMFDLDSGHLELHRKHTQEITELRENGKRDYDNIDANRSQINANLEGIDYCRAFMFNLEEVLRDLKRDMISPILYQLWDKKVINTDDYGKIYDKGLKIEAKLEVLKTDCVGICGFCEIKNTCTNPKRLKQTEKKDKFSKTQLENLRDVEKKRLGENERVVGAIPSIESNKKKPIASSEIDLPNPNSRIHYLKTLPEFYQPHVERKKTFEIRFNDRDFKVGDYLVLEEWDGKKYTGRENTAEVTYILKPEGSFFSFLGKYIIMGIRF